MKKKLLGALAAASMIVGFSASTVSADVTGLLIQEAMDELVACDP